MKIMTEEKLRKVYAILVEQGGANPCELGDFIASHLDSLYPCREWRFCGVFGFGGKYRIETNKVDFYAEDSTPLRVGLRNHINDELLKIK